MEKDKECVLNISTFDKYWKLLLLNYNQKNTHEIQQKRLLCYSLFKNINEKDFEIAIRNTILNQKFFPNANEIYKHLPNKLEQKLNEWEAIKKENATEEEQKELQELLKEFK